MSAPQVRAWGFPADLRKRMLDQKHTGPHQRAAYRCMRSVCHLPTCTNRCTRSVCQLHLPLHSQHAGCGDPMWCSQLMSRTPPRVRVRDCVTV